MARPIKNFIIKIKRSYFTDISEELAVIIQEELDKQDTVLRDTIQDAIEDIIDSN